MNKNSSTKVKHAANRIFQELLNREIDKKLYVYTNFKMKSDIALSKFW